MHYTVHMILGWKNCKKSAITTRYQKNENRKGIYVLKKPLKVDFVG